MKCMNNPPCDEEGTRVDPESPAIFINPEDPTGPKVQPVKCDKHYREMMARRAENEASFDRMVRGMR